MSTRVEHGGRYSSLKTFYFSIGAASLHINKRNNTVGLFIKHVFIAFIIFTHGNNAHVLKVR